MGQILDTGHRIVRRKDVAIARIEFVEMSALAGAGADPQRAGGIESGALGESRDRDMPRRLGLGHRRFATGEDFRRIGGEDLRRALAVEAAEPPLGRASWRERVCQYV